MIDVFYKVNIVLFLLLVLFVSACSKSERLEEEYLAVTLRINDSLSFDELEQKYEDPLEEELDSIGEIIGDGMPLNEYGKPYAVDIEFDILKSEFNHFKEILGKYQFPEGSYLEINGIKECEL